MRFFTAMVFLLLLSSCGSIDREEQVVAATPMVVDGTYHTLRVVYITSPAYGEYPATYAGMRVELVSAPGKVISSVAFDSASVDFPPAPGLLVQGNTFLLLGVPFDGTIARYTVSADKIEEHTTATDKTVFPGKLIYDTLLLGANAYNEQVYYCPFSGKILPEEELVLRDDTTQTRTLFFLVSKATGSARAQLFYYENTCAADTARDRTRFLGSYPGSTYGFDSVGLVRYKEQFFRSCEQVTLLLDGKYLAHVFIHAQDADMVMCSERSGDITQLVTYSRDGKILWNYAFPDAATGALMPGSTSTIEENTIVIAFNASQYLVLDKSTGTELSSYY
jgi:hypothetical protein